MAKRAAHSGSFESMDAATSYADVAGACMDLTPTHAQFGAKGPGSLGLKLRTVLAGVAITFFTATSAGAVTFAENVSMTAGKTLAAQAMTATTIVTSSTINSQTISSAAAFTGTLATAGSMISGDEFRFVGKTRMISASDGLLLLTNAAGSVGATLTVGALTVSTGTTAVQALTVAGILTMGGSGTTGASAGDIVVAQGGALRSVIAGSARPLIYVDANSVIQLGDAGNYAVALPRFTGVAANVNNKGILYADNGTAGQLVFFDGVSGARYKITGVAF